MVLNATFNSCSFIPMRSVLLVEESGVLGEIHRSVASHWQTLSHNILHRVYIAVGGTRAHNFIGNRHWLLMLVYIKLLYDHDPSNWWQRVNMETHYSTSRDGLFLQVTNRTNINMKRQYTLKNVIQCKLNVFIANTTLVTNIKISGLSSDHDID